MRLRLKLWHHCTKWWYHAENDAITAQNEKVAHKILRSCRKLWSLCTKWWYHAENNAATTQYEKVASKILTTGNDDIMQNAITVQNIEIVRKIMKSLHKMVI